MIINYKSARNVRITACSVIQLSDDNRPILLEIVTASGLSIRITDLPMRLGGREGRNSRLLRSLLSPLQ